MIDALDYTPAFRVEHVTKEFNHRKVVDDVSFEVAKSQLTLARGPSGSGKTTVLNMLSTILTPDQGSVYIDERDITKAKKRDKERFRANAGIIFQRSGLLTGLSGEDNIKAPHELKNTKIDCEWLDYLVKKLGVDGILKQNAGTYSGGQAQRVGIVRALAHMPEYVFADEPTASLDIDSKHEINRLLYDVKETIGSTVFVVSHDDVDRSLYDETIELRDGRIRNDQD